MSYGNFMPTKFWNFSVSMKRLNVYIREYLAQLGLSDVYGGGREKRGHLAHSVCVDVDSFGMPNYPRIYPSVARLKIFCIILRFESKFILVSVLSNSLCCKF